MTSFDHLVAQVQFAAAAERRLATLVHRRERLSAAFARYAEAAERHPDQGRSAAAEIDRMVRVSRLIRRLEAGTATMLERLLAAGALDASD